MKNEILVTDLESAIRAGLEHFRATEPIEDEPLPGEDADDTTEETD